MALCAALSSLVGCGGGSAGSEAAPRAPASAAAEVSPGYPISTQGGTPATGPGERYNHCERIWCLEHGENFFIDHFLVAHIGYVFHDPGRGDVYAPRFRSGGPAFPKARQAALFLCGSHVHPWVLGRSGGTPVRHTGYNRTLGYGRDHFHAYGTRLDPCCINGLGSGYVHTQTGKTFHFQDLAEFRAHPEIGWQKPFAARAHVEQK